ncbi:MAG: hypothetical protein H6834_12975 [Planctomycetes bacterium]|nr:hypothetical protein [Planctomycetota bacterium]
MKTHACLALLAWTILAVDSTAQKPNYQNTEHGFELYVPKKWSEVPIRSGEEWILCKFLCDKTYYHKDKDGILHDHKPTLRVLGFPKKTQAVTGSGAEKKNGEKKDEAGEKKDDASLLKLIKNPYRDYRDYLERHHQGGGWFFSLEEDIEVRDLPVLHQEIKVEKLTYLPRRSLAYTYDLPDMKLVVEVDVVEDEYTSLRRSMYKILGSLRQIEKVATQKETAENPFAVVGKDRAARRKVWVERKRAWRDRVLREARDRLPDDWHMEEDDYFLVLSHASPRYTDVLHKQAISVRRWLDENFEEIGEGEVLKSIIRVCASPEEERAYGSGSGDSWSADTGEVVCSEGGYLEFEFTNIAFGLTQQYFSEKNPDLWEALPSWMTGGIHSYVINSRLTKRDGLSFYKPHDLFNVAQKVIEERRMVPVQDLFLKTRKQVQDAGLSEEEYWAVTNLLTRHLIELPKKKSEWWKGYIRKVVDGLDERDQSEFEKVFDRDTTKKPMSEAEEDEYFKNAAKRRKETAQAFEEAQQEFLKSTYDDVFTEWDERDWKKLQRDYEVFVKRAK